MINEALEELPAQLREQEAARVSRAARLRLSWWDQAVDEGYVYPDAAPAAAAGDEDALGAQQTVGSLLQGLVKQWAADECLRMDTLVRTAVDEHVRAAVAAKQQAAAAAAAAAAAVAAAVAAAAAAQPSVDNAQLDVTQLVAGEEAAVDVRASLDVEHEEAAVQPAGASAPAATEPSAAASSTTFSLAADGGLDIFNLSACQAERSDGAAAAATAAAPTAPPSAAAYLPAAALSMADVLSDAMTSLNAATRAAAADAAEDAAISSRLFARGGLDDFSALGGSAGVDDVEDEDDGEPLSGGCDDVDDEAASAALALVSRGAAAGALTRLTLDVKCGGAGAVNPGGAGVTPRGVAAESPGGCPFGGIHLALLPQATDGEEGDEEEAAATGGAGGRVSLAATGAAAAAAAAPASKSSAFSMAALASSLGLDDVGASADADVRSVTSLAGLFGCPPGGAGADDAEGGPASASAAAGAHPGRMSLARVLEEAAAAGAAAAGAQRQRVLVFDKLTGEASMVSVAINGSSAGPSVSPSLPGSDDAHAPEAFAPLAELLPLHAGGGAGALPPAPLYAARAGGGGSSGGPPGGVVVPIAARVGPFSPARVAAAAAAAVAVAGGAAGTAAQHVSPRLTHRIPAAAAAATVVGCPAAAAAAGSGAPPAAGQGPAGALASGVSRRLELDAR